MSHLRLQEPIVIIVNKDYLSSSVSWRRIDGPYRSSMVVGQITGAIRFWGLFVP